jgi:hypothetical protein
MFEDHHQEQDSEETRSTSEDIRVYGHKYLKIRLIVYLAIAAIMIGISVYDIIQGHVDIISTVMSISIGILVGFIVSRMHHISWDRNAQKVIAQLDTVGIIILLVYILLEINRERIVEYFVHSESPLAISFAVFAGIMIGRLLGIRRRVRQVISENL